MNKVDLIGRLTKDPEVRYQTNGETGEKFARARFTLAVNRKQKDNNGNYLADFIWCEAAGKLGELAEKYLRKGMRIAVSGALQTGSYKDNNGNTVYTWGVRASDIEFLEKKAENTYNAFSGNNAGETADGFMPIPDGMDEDLPFA